MDFGFLRRKPLPIIGESDLKRSVVEIVLTENEEVVFEVRSVIIAYQPGDICLPGGEVEGGETPEEAVVRELSEELRVNKDQVQAVVPFSVFVTGMQEIHCFVCRIYGYQGTFQAEEVARILQVPLSFFLETSPEIHEVVWKPEMDEDFPFERIHGGRDYGWRDHRSRIRFYEYGENTIWGITARIMEAFSQQIKGKEHNLSIQWTGTITEATSDRMQ